MASAAPLYGRTLVSLCLRLFTQQEGPNQIADSAHLSPRNFLFLRLPFSPFPASILPACEGNVVDWISARKRITSHPRKTRAQRRVRFHPFVGADCMKTDICRALGPELPNRLAVTLSGAKPLICGKNQIKPLKNHLAKVPTPFGRGTNHINRLFERKNDVIPDNARTELLERIQICNRMRSRRTLTERLQNG